VRLKPDVMDAKANVTVIGVSTGWLDAKVDVIVMSAETR
jgi:hypothetical protein